jgi:alkylation response protein AidB-like acyl-CoA dehydrogenase
MDFDFTQEQAMLRDLTREFMNRESAPRVVRALMNEVTGYSPTAWQQMAEMGLQGLAVDAGYGGQGLGAIEQAIVLEEMGRAAMPSPYFATCVLAASAIALADEASKARFLPDIAAGRTKATLAFLETKLDWTADAVSMRATRDGNGFVLSGEKRFVPWAHIADLLLVAAHTERGLTLFAVPREASGVRTSENVEIDHTSRTSTVYFDNVRVSAEDVIGRVDEGWSILEPVLQRAAVGACAEMLGAARRCMEMSVEYAKMRQQFGQPIGMFQAIKHMCAEMLLEVENSFGATYYAAWALDAGAGDVALAAACAKAYVNEASRNVCGNAIQVHGGIGFTWEYDLHLYFKRAKHNEPLYGDADFHRERALQLRLAREVTEAEEPQREPALASD